MAVFSFLACLYLPWWCIAVIVFLIAVIIPQKPGKTFLCAFIALFLLWAGLSFWLSYSNHNLLANKISLLVFNFESPVVLILLTGLIGGLVAGFAGLTGSFVRYKQAVEKEHLKGTY